MKILKKPTKAHKSKKVIKAHQGFAADGSRATAEQSKPKSQSVSARPQGQVATAQAPRTPRVVQDKVLQSERRRNPNFDTEYRLSTLSPSEKKELNTQREINTRMRGNKVVTDNQAELQRRNAAEIKRRGGRDKLQAEQMDYYRGRGKVKRPERIDPFKGMSSRERRRAQNATRSEFDETNRQVRKQMGTQRKPRQELIRTAPQPIRKPRPLGGIQIPDLLGAIGKPTQSIPRPEVSSPQNQPTVQQTYRPRKNERGTPSLVDQIAATRVATTTPPQLRNKGGVVKKKYTEVKALKQGGYVSRAKYGSVDNLKKKK